MAKSPYEVLEVHPGASEKEIKQAYRDLAKIWHPDRFAHDPKLREKATKKLQEINLAYTQLRSKLNYEEDEQQKNKRAENQKQKKSAAEKERKNTEEKRDRPFDAESYNYQGLVNLNCYNFDAAIRDFSNAILLDPQFVTAYINRGWAYYKQGYFDRAINDYDKALEIEPDNISALTNKNIAHSALNAKRNDPKQSHYRPNASKPSSSDNERKPQKKSSDPFGDWISHGKGWFIMVGSMFGLSLIMALVSIGKGEKQPLQQHESINRAPTSATANYLSAVRRVQMGAQNLREAAVYRNDYASLSSAWDLFQNAVNDLRFVPVPPENSSGHAIILNGAELYKNAYLSILNRRALRIEFSPAERGWVMDQINRANVLLDQGFKEVGLR